MKRKYEAPAAKLYDIALEEKIAATCLGSACYDLSEYGCSNVLRGNGGSCTGGGDRGS